jgi:hypothetical protein
MGVERGEEEGKVATTPKRISERCDILPPLCSFAAFYRVVRFQLNLFRGEPHSHTQAALRRSHSNPYQRLLTNRVIIGPENASTEREFLALNQVPVSVLDGTLWTGV